MKKSEYISEKENNHILLLEKLIKWLVGVRTQTQLAAELNSLQKEKEFSI